MRGDAGLDFHLRDLIVATLPQALIAVSSQFSACVKQVAAAAQDMALATQLVSTVEALVDGIGRFNDALRFGPALVRSDCQTLA